jgi:hypothetical protein
VYLATAALVMTVEPRVSGPIGLRRRRCARRRSDSWGATGTDTRPFRR